MIATGDNALVDREDIDYEEVEIGTKMNKT